MKNHFLGAFLLVFWSLLVLPTLQTWKNTIQPFSVSHCEKFDNASFEPVENPNPCDEIMGASNEGAARRCPGLPTNRKPLPLILDSNKLIVRHCSFIANGHWAMASKGKGKGCWLWGTTQICTSSNWSEKSCVAKFHLWWKGSINSVREPFHRRLLWKLRTIPSRIGKQTWGRSLNYPWSVDRWRTCKYI